MQFFSPIIFGVAYTILVQIFLEPLCYLLGATEESISYCLAYGRPIALGFTFSAIAGSFTSIVRADGRANVSMIGMFIGCIVNLILDPIFIYVFKWGTAGAAWATFIGQLLNAVFFLFSMTRYKTVKLLRQIVIFVPVMLLLSISGDVIKVLWTGPISDGASCVISVIVLLFCWKKLFKKDVVKEAEKI